MNEIAAPTPAEIELYTTLLQMRSLKRGERLCYFRGVLNDAPQGRALGAEAAGLAREGRGLLTLQRIGPPRNPVTHAIDWEHGVGPFAYFITGTIPPAAGIK